MKLDGIVLNRDNPVLRWYNEPKEAVKMEVPRQHVGRLTPNRRPL